MLFYNVYWQYLMPAYFIVLQLRSDSCQIHGYVMLCQIIPQIAGHIRMQQSDWDQLSLEFHRGTSSRWWRCRHHRMSGWSQREHAQPRTRTTGNHPQSSRPYQCREQHSHEIYHLWITHTHKWQAYILKTHLQLATSYNLYWRHKEQKRVEEAETHLRHPQRTSLQMAP